MAVLYREKIAAATEPHYGTSRLPAILAALRFGGEDLDLASDRLMASFHHRHSERTGHART